MQLDSKRDCCGKLLAYFESRICIDWLKHVWSIRRANSDARRFSMKIANFEAKPLDFSTRPIFRKNH